MVTYWPFSFSDSCIQSLVHDMSTFNHTIHLLTNQTHFVSQIMIYILIRSIQGVNKVVNLVVCKDHIISRYISTICVAYSRSTKTIQEKCLSKHHK